MRGGDKTGADQSTAQEILPHQPVQAKPLEVEVYDHFEKAMRYFRAMVQKEGVLALYKEHQSYEKPSDKKRRKRNEAIRAQMEAEFKDKDKDEDKPRKRKSKYNTEDSE